MPWGEGDLPLLEMVVGDEAMMGHLGGPESPQKIAERQAKYARPDSRQFRIVVEATGESAGWVGYWERTWRGEDVYEIGWSVIPAFQGRGLATLATLQAIERARSDERHSLHAFPSVGNAPSNALCRTVGFTLVGACDFEYPPGSVLQCNDWLLDLFRIREVATKTQARHMVSEGDREFRESLDQPEPGDRPLAPQAARRVVIAILQCRPAAMAS